MLPEPMRTLRAQLSLRLPFFEGLSEAEQALLLRGSTLLSYPQGAYVYGGEAEQCVGLLLVLSGTLRVYLLSEQGRDVTLYRVPADDVCLLSASCVLQEITFAVHIDAETPVTAVQIAAPTFAALQQENITVENYGLRLSAQRFSEIMFAMQQVLFLGVDQRIARYLLLQEAPLIRHTHEEIARDTGTAREVVSRMLGRFAQEGLVAHTRGAVRVLDRAGLSRLAQ